MGKDRLDVRCGRAFGALWLALGLGVMLAGNTAAYANARGRECIPEEECCKVCSGGRACGNTCISAAKTCHKGRGCACNKEELCQ